MTDYNKLAEALRRCANRDTICTTEDNCGYLGKGFFCTDALMTDAADAIEALQAEIRESMQRCAECGDELAHQMPKRGEWIHVEGDEPWEWRCTVCHEIAEGRGEFRFCPNCGAKMEVQE
jgi:hypothetical protein